MYRKSLKSLTSTPQQEGLFPESVIILEMVQWESSAYKWSMWFVCVGGGTVWNEFKTNNKANYKSACFWLSPTARNSNHIQD